MFTSILILTKTLQLHSDNSIVTVTHRIIYSTFGKNDKCVYYSILFIGNESYYEMIHPYYSSVLQCKRVAEHLLKPGEYKSKST